MMSLSLFSMMLTVAVFFVQFTSPHFMAVGLIFQTIFMSSYLSSVKIYPWLAYVLFLVFLGGVLVLFTYVSSLLSEKKMEKLPLVLISVSGAAIWSSVSMGYFFVLGSVSSESMGKEVSLKSHVKEFFSTVNSGVYLFTVLYLLLALICVASMMKSKQGPLRKLN